MTCSDLHRYPDRWLEPRCCVRLKPQIAHSKRPIYRTFSPPTPTSLRAGAKRAPPHAKRGEAGLCRLGHGARLRAPDFGGVLGDGAVAGEFSGTRDVQDGLSRPLLRIGVQLE